MLKQHSVTCLTLQELRELERRTGTCHSGNAKDALLQQNASIEQQRSRKNNLMQNNKIRKETLFQGSIITLPLIMVILHNLWKVKTIHLKIFREHILRETQNDKIVGWLTHCWQHRSAIWLFPEKSGSYMPAAHLQLEISEILGHTTRNVRFNR